MANPFSARRGDDGDDEGPIDALKRRQSERERERDKRLVALKVGYYFDPVTREVLRRVGNKYVFVRHDRRRTDRLTPAEAETGRMILIQGGLFWDAQSKAVYQFRSGHYVLYSRDRRRIPPSPPGKSPTGKDRRKVKP